MKDYITLEDFKRVEVGQGVYYLSMQTDDYEITLEPHFTAGFTIGVYHKDDPLLSVQKRAVWKFNHPTNKPRESIQQELINRAMEVAQYFYTYYVLRQREAVPPWLNRNR